jgi:MFS family permease
VVALGSLTGALISAGRTRTRLRTLVAVAATLATLDMVAAAAPAEWAYCLVMVAVGACTLLFLTSANSTVQLAAGDSIRGRVMSVYLLVFIGSGAFGGPLIGWLDQHFGPRTGMLVSGLVPAVATALVAVKLARLADVRLRPATVRALLKAA